MRRAFPPDLRQRLTGATVTSLPRRAKYGLIATDRGDTLVFHLGMSGRWRIDPAELGAHDHFLLETDEGRRPRSTIRAGSARSTWCRRSRSNDASRSRPWGRSRSGRASAADYLLDALHGRSAPIKALLLDQRIVAGLGNIYVCEALHMAGIAPSRAGGRISRPRLERLVEAVRAVLLAAIEAGGSSLRDYARPSGELGYFSKQWRVYGREGEACHCGSPDSPAHRLGPIDLLLPPLPALLRLTFRACLA